MLKKVRNTIYKNIIVLKFCNDDKTISQINLDSINFSQNDAKLNSDSVNSLLENINEHIKIILDGNRKIKHKISNNNSSKISNNSSKISLNSETKKSKNKIETKKENKKEKKNKNKNNITPNAHIKAITNIKELASNNINHNLKIDHKNTYNCNPKTFCGFDNSNFKSPLKKEPSFKLHDSIKNNIDILGTSRKKSGSRRNPRIKFSIHDRNCSLNRTLKNEKYEFDNKINNIKENNNTISQITSIKSNNDDNNLKKFYTDRKFFNSKAKKPNNKKRLSLKSYIKKVNGLYNDKNNKKKFKRERETKSCYKNKKSNESIIINDDKENEINIDTNNNSFNIIKNLTFIDTIENN